MALFRFKIMDASFVKIYFEQKKHHEEKEILEFFPNGAELSMNYSNFSESDKSLKHELGSI